MYHQIVPLVHFRFSRKTKRLSWREMQGTFTNLKYHLQVLFEKSWIQTIRNTFTALFYSTSYRLSKCDHMTVLCLYNSSHCHISAYCPSLNCHAVQKSSPDRLILTGICWKGIDIDPLFIWLTTAHLHGQPFISTSEACWANCSMVTSAWKQHA